MIAQNASIVCCFLLFYRESKGKIFFSDHSKKLCDLNSVQCVQKGVLE